jgi:hypothetical protein
MKLIYVPEINQAASNIWCRVLLEGNVYLSTKEICRLL